MLVMRILQHEELRQAELLSPLRLAGGNLSYFTHFCKCTGKGSDAPHIRETLRGWFFLDCDLESAKFCLAPPHFPALITR